MLRLLFAGSLALSTLLAACATGPNVDYRYMLDDVIRNPDVGAQMNLYPAPRGGIAEDSLIRVDHSIRGGFIEIEVLNKTNETLYIVWDEAAFVDHRGVASQMVSGEMRTMNVGLSQPSAVLPAGSLVRLVAVPTAQVEQGRIQPFFRGHDDLAKHVDSKTRLVIPIRKSDDAETGRVEYTLVNKLTAIPR